MRFFTRIAILFYVVTISTIGFLAIFFAYVVDTPLLARIHDSLDILQNHLQMRTIIGLVGFILILLSFLFAKLIAGFEQKERTIAFDNPAGRVSISLGAIEDMVKRLVLRETEVKEVRPNIIATKKGLQAEARLVLKADVNIPEVTARLQELIKSKIQDMIGIEEKVGVRIHVVKIISEEPRSKRDKDNYRERSEPTIPFQGYRA